jgi:hypothetical protein
MRDDRLRLPLPAPPGEKAAARQDHAGQALAYVYFEEEPGRRSATKLLSEDEAERSFTAPLLLHGNGIAKAFTEDEKNYTNK